MATVLIIEDDRDSRETLGELLAMNGFDVAGAGDGREALERLRTVTPDVILLDVVMHPMAGREFLDRWSANPRAAGTRIVAVSGAHPRIPEVADVFRRVDAIVAKPFDPAHLVALLRDLTTSAARG